MSAPDIRSQNDQKDTIMILITEDLARSRIRDLEASAEMAARVRRLRAARRWARRAEHAARRAARANAAVR